MATTTFLLQAACDTEALGPGFCPAGQPGYPRVKKVVMKPLPHNLPTMPDPCKGVPANAWCPAQEEERVDRRGHGDSAPACRRLTLAPWPPPPRSWPAGPGQPGDIQIAWRPDPFEPGADASAEADRLLEELRERGSPSYDGLAARMVSFEQTDDGLRLELQPIRWALRLLPADAGDSISALCVVRDADGKWLAGPAGGWVASWAGRWALGAGGSVEVDENPTDTLARELEEEWSVEPERLQVEALVRLAKRDGDVRRPGVAAGGRDRHARRRARRVRLVAGRRRALAGRGRRAAAQRWLRCWQAH